MKNTRKETFRKDVWRRGERSGYDGMEKEGAGGDGSFRWDGMEEENKGGDGSFGGDGMLEENAGGDESFGGDGMLEENAGGDESFGGDGMLEENAGGAKDSWPEAINKGARELGKLGAAALAVTL